MIVRVYSYVNDGSLYMKVLSDPNLFDRYGSFISRERQVRYDYVEVVDGVIRDLDDADVVSELEDFGY